MYFPIYVDVRGKKTLVVGLGKVGRRRAQKLRDYGANVEAIDKIPVELKGVKTIQMDLKSSNIPALKDYFLVVIATNDEELNAAIARKAKGENVLVNRADKFEDGDLVFPATIKHKDDIVSITTLGKNPSLAREVKKLIEDGISKD